MVLFNFLDGDEPSLSAAGFPLPSNANYKKVWQYVDKTKQVIPTSDPVPKPKVHFTFILDTHLLKFISISLILCTVKNFLGK